jgi:two-component system nitrogen regulation sensor histidine kinase GlnL
LLEREFEPESEMLEYTRVVIRETERIDHIIRELLELSSPRALKLAPVNLHRILGDILLLQKQAVSDRKIAFIQHFDPSIPEIMADGEMLTRLFLNLICNAVDAMGVDGRLTVTSRVLSDYRMTQNERHSRMVAIEVGDDGPGIPREDLENIWTPFFSTKSGGTGLGLTICHKIVSEHRGMIKAESDPGHGTIFTVLLPLVR